MPKRINANPRYCHHRASNQAVVTIDGKDFYLGLWKSTASKDEYDRIIGEWLANGRRLAAVSDLSIAELIVQYAGHLEGYYGRPSPEWNHNKAPLALLTRLYGKTRAVEFGPVALDSIRARMVGLGWKRKYVNRQIDRLRSMFRWAVSKQLIPASIHQALLSIVGLRSGHTEAGESKKIMPVADAVVEATLPRMSKVVGAMVQIQRLTGSRPGEVCGMRIGDIDRSGDVWVYRPEQHKSAHHGHQRSIFIGPKAQSVLSPFMLKLNPASYIFTPAEAVEEQRQRRAADRKTPLSCGNTPGSHRVRRPKRLPREQYDVNAYRHAIKYACDLAFPVPDDLAGDLAQVQAWRLSHRWHPHQLRHTAATEIRRQFGIEAAQNVLGHTTPNMTETYAERDSAVARNIAAKIG